MAEYVRVPKKDWISILDATRAKTGHSASMVSGEVSEKIEGIQTGGGGGDTTMEDGLITRTLTEYVNNRVETVAPHAFRGCGSLQSVSMKNCTYVDIDAFNGCSNLKTLDMPMVNYINTRGFNATGFEEITLPLITGIGQGFTNCKGLKKVDLPISTSVLGNAFNGCTVLETLILRSAKVATLQNVNAFAGTPFASGGTGGTVYCPAALITQYQQATNWSTLYAAGTCNFVAIEGSEYE